MALLEYTPSPFNTLSNIQPEEIHKEKVLLAESLILCSVAPPVSLCSLLTNNSPQPALLRLKINDRFTLQIGKAVEDRV